MKTNRIAIIDYPGTLKSATYGLGEMFALANRVSREQNYNFRLNYEVLLYDTLTKRKKTFDIIILPPSTESNYYLSPDIKFTDWLSNQYSKGSLLCSTCAGAFILAAAGLLNNREITTHWSLADKFESQFPDIKLNTNKIIIRHNDIITSGGMMAWIDLGLELIAKLTNPVIMRKVGKMLVIDTGGREQQYYRQFNPKLNHGDSEILKIQHKLHNDFKKKIKINSLAKECNSSDRTFLRRFVKAVGIRPKEYLQKVRIQNVCDQLEETNKTFEQIAYSVGYEDISACRKAFIKIVGLTPKEFRNRFTQATE